MATKTLKIISREEVAKHNTPDDLWIIVDAKVYDVSRFKDLHPGGASVFRVEEIAGQDATEAFYGLHRHEVLKRPQYARLQIGKIEGEESIIFSREVGTNSEVPYGEPSWLGKGFHSPYYKESHRRLQRELRKFVDEVIMPDAFAREGDGKRPSQDVIKAANDFGILAMRMGPGKHLKGLTLANGAVTPEEFDCFHEFIVLQEIALPGQRGYSDGFQSGCVIGLSPVLNFASPTVQAKVVPDVLQNGKFIALAISEAFAGSDVAGIQTTAKKTEDGKHWIVNGHKKWITNGMWADYFTVGCKTEKGHTVILVERQDGVETKPIKTSYSPTAGTALVTFEDVKVPVENTIGKEGDGIYVMLSNFNHERWMITVLAARCQRIILEDCLKWVNQRKAFGKPLSSQAVVRSKIARMVARVESTHNWLENITMQMCHMSYKEQAAKLAGPIALAKMYATQCSQDIAEDAVQVFGGRGITQTGMGHAIEHFHRTVTFDTILGGTEDVLGDLGVRQAIRQMPKNARL
ncbi:acyl-CoA dehydrogenase NM domain-like protein [Coniophora puteana RWD-64-598 SS2]|uniref:Acyl-CoA dehydrogenase NM domain-like protein n=1 Tax=Coniophora puteana (strain RWD-64-598) TaxID=741705 RepID=A0A5M3MY08_CONPW|nr:acyl-CoA dehydrogenase NM domain-like protein [Coniophora puteana RWD-64-598 SS2]EIW84012.1 acyl-CoA dehydrogenase NM domain-like protein [Coniophora puteana RWD-64-598 SS2]